MTAHRIAQAGSLWALLGLLIVLTASCGSQASGPSSPSPDSAFEAEVRRAIDIRTANGLRSDRDWTVAVMRSEASVERSGIFVTLDEAIAIDERTIREAIAFRRSAGLRDDESWVRQVHADLGAVKRYGFLLSPAEAEQLDDRTRLADEVPSVLSKYAEHHPDEWAGFYLHPEREGVAVQVTRNIEQHRRAILALFGPGLVDLEVRSVRWSLAQLDAWNSTLWTPGAQAWLKSVGVAQVGGGSRVDENDVWLDIKIARPDEALADKIMAHFDGHEWLTVEIDVVPALNLAYGALEVTVVDETGTPVSGVQCKIVATIEGAGGDQAFRPSDDDGVCRWGEIHAALYGIEIWRRFDSGLLGTGRVIVPAGGVGRVTIQVGHK